MEDVKWWLLQKFQTIVPPSIWATSALTDKVLFAPNYSSTNLFLSLELLTFGMHLDLYYIL